MDHNSYYVSLYDNLSSYLPKFPSGRIDYTNAKKCPVVIVVVCYNDKFLLLKRSNNVHSYKGKWNFIGGYLDELCKVEDKAFEELREEVGISNDIIKSYKCLKPLILYDKDLGVEWILFPVVVVLGSEPNIVLDWEHTDYKWVKKEEIKDFDCVGSVPVILDKLIQS